MTPLGKILKRRLLSVVSLIFGIPMILLGYSHQNFHRTVWVSAGLILLAVGVLTSLLGTTKRRDRGTDLGRE